MKRIVSLIAAAALMMSLTSALAENNADALQKALVGVKPRVGVTDEYTDFTSRTFTADSCNSYMFNWSTEGRRQKYQRYRVRKRHYHRVQQL